MKKIVIGALMLIAFGVAGTLVTAFFTNAGPTDTVGYHEEATVNGKDIKRLVIDTSSSDITIVPTKSDKIKAVLDGEISERIKDKFKFIVDQDGDTLKVETKSSMYFMIGISIINLKLNVEVPEKVFDSIAVSSSSGQIDIHDLQAGKFQTHVSSGSISVDGVKVDSRFEGDTSSGTVTIKNTVAGGFDLEASSGKLFLENVRGGVIADTSSGSIFVNNQKVNGDIIAKTSSGDVKVSFKEVPTSLSFDFEASSGDGVVNLEGVNYEEKSENRIKGRIGSGEYKLQVRTSSGNFELN